MEELLAGELSLAARERVLCIRLLTLGRSAADVAEVIGRSVNTVYRHKFRYLAEGESALMAENWGGRRNEVLSAEQEAAFIAGFQAAADRGELITAAAMTRALIKQAGREVDDSTIYRMLDRHGWRKVVPRPTHPEADPERRQAFKQTSQH